MAKINLPPANSRSATNGPPPRLPHSFAIAVSNQCGKIGIKRYAVRDNFICSGLPPPSSAAMKVSLNGDIADTGEAKTIAELIERYQLPPQSILVEHNGLAVHRYEWSERPLSEGDRIELVRVVAGG